MCSLVKESCIDSHGWNGLVQEIGNNSWSDVNGDAYFEGLVGEDVLVGLSASITVASTEGFEWIKDSKEKIGIAANALAGVNSLVRTSNSADQRCTQQLVVAVKPRLRRRKYGEGGMHSLGGRCDDEAADNIEPVPISAKVLSQHFHMSLNTAAITLGICATALKKVCRKMGIFEWPFQKLKPIQRRLAKLRAQQQQLIASPSSSASLPPSAATPTARPSPTGGETGSEGDVGLECEGWGSMTVETEIQQLEALEKALLQVPELSCASDDSLSSLTDANSPLTDALLAELLRGASPQSSTDFFFSEEAHPATCEATKKKVAKRSNVSGAVSTARSAPAEGGQANSKALSAGVAGAVGSEQALQSQSEVDSFFIASSSVDALMSCTSAAAAE